MYPLSQTRGDGRPHPVSVLRRDKIRERTEEMYRHTERLDFDNHEDVVRRKLAVTRERLEIRGLMLYIGAHYG